MAELIEIFNAALRRANARLKRSLIADPRIRKCAEYVAHNLKNRTGAHLYYGLFAGKILNTMLTKDMNLVGKPPQLYQAVLSLLDDVHRGRVTADTLIAEMVRSLPIYRNEQQQRIEALVATLNTAKNAVPLSSENIVNLIEKHMSLKGTSRLSVLVVAAAYQSTEEFVGERVLT
jgi:hypothetical protein